MPNEHDRSEVTRTTYQSTDGDSRPSTLYRINDSRGPRSDNWSCPSSSYKCSETNSTILPSGLRQFPMPGVWPGDPVLSPDHEQIPRLCGVPESRQGHSSEMYDPLRGVDHVPPMSARHGESTYQLLVRQAVDHTVQTYRLLQWPSVQGLLGKQFPTADYVMKHETERGMLRVHGRGLGHHDEVNQNQDGAWGDLCLGLPNVENDRFFLNSKDHLGGLAHNGGLQLNKQRTKDLLKSFVDKVLVLHPFVSADWLETAVEVVWRPRLEADLQTAIVLLVMALGQICHFRGDLPGFAPEVFEEIPRSNKESRNDGPHNSRGMRPGDRNIDVVPGLAYFAVGTSILGQHQAWNGLRLAQAHILAALYTAQLASVVESWNWIQSACRICKALLGQNRNIQLSDDVLLIQQTCIQLESDILAELDLPTSGIQDIEAGLPRGLSDNILAMECSEADDKLMYGYQLSLRKSLNVWQNKTYPAMINGDGSYVQNLYGTEESLLSARATCGDQAELWRRSANSHSSIAWQDDEPPATTINAARLRGKFYGATYLIHRPLLYYALHQMEAIDLNKPVMNRYWNWSKYHYQEELEKTPPIDASLQEKRDWATFQILMSSKLCVDAACNSTVAFDGCRRNGRLILTNIFGTAHAQFGNMLVLASVFASTKLRFLIDDKTFIRLLDRTIDFLHPLAAISTTIGEDYKLPTLIRSNLVQKGLISSLSRPSERRTL